MALSLAVSTRTPLCWTRRELALNPAPVLCPLQVSQAAADLLAYCEAHVREDPLIIPVPASENPFREKKFFCTIL
uniref:guanine nucleotide-binding protein G(I)/G(S)/G(O) subunit gamma-4 n=1 Tax=Halichoerus grypus TaxID=9711 RepID=UPI001659F821|nr:guanine nucleotide-binding protein G(I)/G(S)/G(O) subunit gamma-4 [Halichoerus grypus]